MEYLPPLMMSRHVGEMPRWGRSLPTDRGGSWWFELAVCSGVPAGKYGSHSCSWRLLGKESLSLSVSVSVSLSLSLSLHGLHLHHTVCRWNAAGFPIKRPLSKGSCSQFLFPPYLFSWVGSQGGFKRASLCSLCSDTEPLHLNLFLSLHRMLNESLNGKTLAACQRSNFCNLLGILQNNEKQIGSAL